VNIFHDSIQDILFSSLPSHVKRNETKHATHNFIFCCMGMKPDLSPSGKTQTEGVWEWGMEKTFWPNRQK